MSGPTINPEALLAHAGWLRGLALRLTRDPDVADDLVQETWIATVQSEPEQRESLRPWLARVLINLVRMRARGDGRRALREQAAIVGDAPTTPEALVARAEVQRLLVDLVLRLDEPYRSTVLLHFCEGVSLADIARTQNVPAGTVRWRLKFALDQLRGWLDERGDRRRWSVALLAASKGLVVAHRTSKTVLVIAALLLLLVGGVWLSRRGGSEPDPETAGGASTRGTQQQGGERGRGTDNRDDVAGWLGQREVASRKIAGRVMFRGAPVAGATVELASIATESGLGAPMSRITNAAGEFVLGPQRAMEWSVRASAPGKTSATIELDLRNPQTRPDPERLELELGACEASLFGTVRDASGGAIAKARIALLAGTPTVVPGGPAVITDDKGAYELCIHPRWPGWVAVEVSASGYGSIFHSTMAPGRVQADFALIPEATIVGRVVRDDTGAGVAFAHVFVPAGRRQPESTAWRGSFADAEGRFRIDRVAPGRHLVLARADGLVASRGTPVIVEAGQTTPEIEVRLEAGATVRGIVRAAGKPVVGARVAPADLDGRQTARTAISQADGAFVLDEVPRGELKFTASPYEVLSPSSLLVTQPVHEGVVIEVEPMGTIIGRVERQGQPVPGANIHVNGPNDRELPDIRAGADGRFEVRGLRAGPWSLHASDDRIGAFGRVEKIIQLARGATAEATIELAYAGSIAGRVIDQTGAPVSGVSVEVRHTQQDDGGVAVTTADGSFRAATLTGGGQYRAVVRLARLSTSALRPVGGREFPLIAVAGPSSAVTGIVLAVEIDRLAISGVVVDSSGAPIADARVIAEQQEGDAAPRFFGGLQDPSTTTDVDGRFSIANLSSGRYALLGRSPRSGEVVQTGVAAGRADVRLELAMPGTIEGTLVGFRSAPQVSATREGTFSAPIYGSVTGTKFVVRSLAPGKYVVTARTANEATSAVVEVAAESSAQLTLTSRGSGIIVGRVREFRSNKPIEGMSCRAAPRGADPFHDQTGEAVRSDATGAFTIASAPAGEIVVACDGLWRLYSNGLRSTTLQAERRVELDIPIVGWREEVAHSIADYGGDLEHELPLRLSRVKPGGAAATAGFANGDQLQSVDGVAVGELSPNGAWILIANRPPGSKVKLTVMRGAQSITGELTLTEMPTF